MVIAVDFDGTIVENRFPEIGRERPFAVETLRMLAAEGHRLVLWSCREGQLLDEALGWCHERGLEFWAVNRDYPEETVENNPHWTRKLKADLFIDDRQVGGLPDWGVIYQMVTRIDNYVTRTDNLVTQKTRKSQKRATPELRDDVGGTQNQRSMTEGKVKSRKSQKGLRDEGRVKNFLKRIFKR